MVERITITTHAETTHDEFVQTDQCGIDRSNNNNKVQYYSAQSCTLQSCRGYRSPFLTFQKLLEKVVSGDLPCSKEEAATLAGIQLRIEESWGRPVLRDESFLLEVPTFGPGGNLRPVSPLMEDAEGEEGETDSKKPPSGVTTPGYQKTIAVPCAPLSNVVKPSQSILSRCYPFSSSTVPFLPSGRIEDCLPPCYREQAKYMSKLIKSTSSPGVFVAAYTSRSIWILGADTS
ncbi:hypothetical protein M8J76_006273 [Diaphorina citri]|nr:hypothetical protein M8J76_006273 [Diaphorina citri]